MLAENRAALHNTLDNVNAASSKFSPLIEDLRKTAAQADDTLSHADSLIAENRPDLKKAIEDLRTSLSQVVTLTAQLNNTLGANTENLDEIIANLRTITENMNEFTETIKTRPYTLIRASGVKPHRPGQAPPK
jgi:phospholipid/cholesterol/gamma-HCH transport system substrate-binding protein